MTVRLEKLLAAATPGPWEALDAEDEEPTVVPWVGRTLDNGEIDPIADDLSPANAELAALAPDAVRLLIDMGDYLRRPYSQATANALLARLDRLGNLADLAIIEGRG